MADVQHDVEGSILPFTVFVPTFNRAHTIRRALDSVAAQTFRECEIVIIDDGSTDGTAELVEQWRREVDLPVTYVVQENAGKHAAHNQALQCARGELFAVLDSDDAFVPEALERLWFHWTSIPESERPGFCGVEGLTAFFDGRVSGTRFPRDVMDSDYITLRREHRIRGDKKGALRTDLLRQFPYPTYPGERHMRPSWLWKNLAQHYRTRYFNEVIQYIEYQPGGLSSNRFRLRMANPRGYRRYFLEEVNRHGHGHGPRDRIDACSMYVRYSWHAGIGPIGQCRDIEPRWLWCLALLPGTVKWLGDRIRMRSLRRERSPS